LNWRPNGRHDMNTQLIELVKEKNHAAKKNEKDKPASAPDVT